MDTRTYLLFFITLVKCLHVFCDSVAYDWSYYNIPDWKKTFPRCNGSEQSPINIIDNDAVTVSNAGELRFENYERTLHMGLANNGKTVQLSSMFININLTVSGLGMYLQNNFTLQQVHFHWGNTDDSGSEHRIDGIGSAMEVHFVHFNLEKYSDIKSAQQNTDGVLVLSVLVEVSKNAPFKSVWQNITFKLANIMKPNSKTTLHDVSLQQLLPKNRREFYFYRGSFTTPSCLESVTWVVFKEKLVIPQEYVQNFRELLRTTMNEDGSALLSSNTRPVQQLYSREVLKTFYTSTSHKYLWTGEKVVGGHGAISIVRFHACQLPPSLSLSVVIPSLDINWKGSNLTSDWEQIKMLDPNQSYGVALEMHAHPVGQKNNTMHVKVSLTDSPRKRPVDVINHYFKKCVIDTCSWLKPAMDLTCNRQLVTSGAMLSFTLTLQDVCLDLYHLVVKKDTRVFLSTPVTKNKRVHFKNIEHILQPASLNDWDFVLNVDKTSDVNNAKLFVEIDHVFQKVLVMEGDYGPVLKCASSTGSTPHHVKLIVGVAVGIFILTMVLLTVCLLWRRLGNKPAGSLLVPQTEEDTVV